MAGCPGSVAPQRGRVAIRGPGEHLGRVDGFDFHDLGRRHTGSRHGGVRPGGGRQGEAERIVKTSKLAYGVVLDAHGGVLATSDGIGAEVVGRMRNASHVKEALAGRATLSDMVRDTSGWVLEWAHPVRTPSGRRVQVEGVPAKPLSDFFGGYLARGHTSDTGATSSTARIGSSAPSPPPTSRAIDRTTGALLAGLASAGTHTYRDGSTSQYFTTARVPGASWRVVLSEPESSLYPARGGSRSALLYLVLAALRAGRAREPGPPAARTGRGARLGEANRELATVNATLEERVAERTAAAERPGEGARSIERGARTVRIDRLPRPPGAAAQDPDVRRRVRSAVGDELPEQARTTCCGCRTRPSACSG